MRSHPRASHPAKSRCMASAEGDGVALHMDGIPQDDCRPEGAQGFAPLVLLSDHECTQPRWRAPSNTPRLVLRLLPDILAGSGSLHTSRQDAAK